MSVGDLAKSLPYFSLGSCTVTLTSHSWESLLLTATPTGSDLIIAKLIDEN
jgi:hypothetical protein